MDTLTLIRPDDWHLHLRDDDALRAVVGASARQFARAIVMPNLKPPVTTVAQAQAYRARILEALVPAVAADPACAGFDPLMTLYLTDRTAPDEIRRARASGFVHAVKLYPAGATTNSDAGVTSIAAVRPALEAMQASGLPLLIHGEVTDAHIDVFDREAVFLERHLAPLLQRHPGLKVVLEHITTAEAVDFVAAAGPNLAATITPHHLHLNRNALFAGGLRPDFYCLPVIKRERHRLALRAAAVSGQPCFFLGTDSAPHPRHAKESACGCAGIFNSPFAIESYATVFEQEGALERLEAFASEFGPRFYGLTLNEDRLVLRRQSLEVPQRLHLADRSGAQHELVPFHAGQRLPWCLERGRQDGVD